MSVVRLETTVCVPPRVDFVVVCCLCSLLSLCLLMLVDSSEVGSWEECDRLLKLSPRGRGAMRFTHWLKV